MSLLRKKILSLALCVCLAAGLLAVPAAAAETETAVADEVVALIKSWEGFTARRTGGYIGYGTAVSAGAYPDGITEAEADALLRQTLAALAAKITAFFSARGVTLTQPQRSALASLSYNTGIGWMRDSYRLVRTIISGGYTANELASALGVWCHVGSSVDPYLARHRAAEAAMFLYGDYSGTGDRFCYLIFSASGGSVSTDIRFYEAGQPYGTLEIPTGGGYFDGWYTSSGEKLSASDIAAKSMTVTARWAESEPAAPAGRFSDVPADAWYGQYMDKLVAAGPTCPRPRRGSTSQSSPARRSALTAAVRSVRFRTRIPARPPRSMPPASSPARRMARAGSASHQAAPSRARSRAPSSAASWNGGRLPMLSRVTELAREAGAVIRSADHIEARSKSGPADFVTQYDGRVEQFLKEALTALRPDAQFLGEESAHAVDESSPLWIVDPIDGTTNFIRGFSRSAVSICLCDRGVRQLGVIYDPYTDQLYAAERGRGAFLNGAPIHVSSRPASEGISIFGTAAYNREFSDATFRLARALFDRTLDVRRFGAAVLDFCDIAAGRAELFCECLLSPWDFAAGALIVEEAGGAAAALDGSPLPIAGKSSVFCSNAACASERAALYAAASPLPAP